MARYIVIDNASGQIIGDTYMLDPTNTTYDEAYTACRDLDDEIGIRNRLYQERTRPFERGEPGYLVYREMTMRAS